MPKLSLMLFAADKNDVSVSMAAAAAWLLSADDIKIRNWNVLFFKLERLGVYTFLTKLSVACKLCLCQDDVLPSVYMRAQK